MRLSHAELRLLPRQIRASHFAVDLFLGFVCLCPIFTTSSTAIAQSRYISDLRVIFDKEAVPDGFSKIPTDLNKGAKGKFIYLCYRETTNPNDAIRGLKILEGENAAAPGGFTKVARDLNSGAKGAYLFLAFSKDRSAGEPIREIKFDVSETELSKRNKLGQGGLAVATSSVSAYTYLKTDLNKGAGGSFIYLMYR